jgi:outer membrane protein assembly factor BamB
MARTQVFCFDAVSGKPVWKHSYPAELGDKYYEGGTTGTPTFDGDRLYWLSRWGDLFCFEAGLGARSFGPRT